MAAWTTPWEGLLDFDLPKGDLGAKRAKLNTQHAPAPHAPASKLTLGVIPPPHVTPGSVATFGHDLAWKTILGSMVDVEGVGEVGVVRVLQEVWKRGGGDAVSGRSWLKGNTHRGRSHHNVYGRAFSYHYLFLPSPTSRNMHGYLPHPHITPSQYNNCITSR
jgi:hypothetical protein